MATLRLLAVAGIGLMFGCDASGDTAPGQSMPQQTGAAAQAIDSQTRAVEAGNTPAADQIGAQAGALQNSGRPPRVRTDTKRD